MVGVYIHEILAQGSIANVAVQNVLVGEQLMALCAYWCKAKEW